MGTIDYRNSMVVYPLDGSRGNDEKWVFRKQTEDTTASRVFEEIRRSGK